MYLSLTVKMMFWPILRPYGTGTKVGGMTYGPYILYISILPFLMLFLYFSSNTSSIGIMITQFFYSNKLLQVSNVRWTYTKCLLPFSYIKVYYVKRVHKPYMNAPLICTYCHTCTSCKFVQKLMCDFLLECGRPNSIIIRTSSRVFSLCEELTSKINE